LLALVQDEAKELVKGSFLEDAPVVAMSARTGEGLDELKSALREVALRVPARSEDFLKRLPIDRAFTMSGFGAVVTGTLIAGEINEGDELELLPQQTRVRVRGLQVHGSKVKRAMAGQRTAVNLGGVETAALERGMVLAPPERFRPTQIIDASVTVIDDAARGLRTRQRVRVHAGAAEVLARVKVLESGTGVSPVSHAQDARATIRPGSSGFIQLRLETPIVGVLGDRFIIRSYSPQRTIGGGIILDAFAAKHRARELASVRERLNTVLVGAREQQVAAFVNDAAHGLTRADLAARTGWRSEVVEAATKSARASGLIAEAGGQLLAPATLEALKENIVKDIGAHHAAEPLSRGLGLEILRRRHFAHASPDLFRTVVNDLEKAQSVVIEKDIARLPEHGRAMSKADAALRDRLEAVYREAKLASPSIGEALTRAGVAAPEQQHGRKVLQVLIDSGKLIRVDGDMFFHRDALDEMIGRLRTLAAKTPDRALDVPAFKEMTGISRKYAIPLLEYLDRERITRREGDRRIVL
jgi:selenocysteine-specific elongation factor